MKRFKTESQQERAEMRREQKKIGRKRARMEIQYAEHEEYLMYAKTPEAFISR